MKKAKPKPITVKVKLFELIRDWNLWPRAKAAEHRVDMYVAYKMLDALKAGRVFPAFIADRKSNRIIDGFYRYEAYILYASSLSLKLYDIEVEVEYRDYDSDAAMFKDAVLLNSSHGLKLSSLDKAYISIRARFYKLTLEELGLSLGMTPKAIAQVQARVAVNPSGEEVPLSGGVQELSFEKLGRKLTTEEDQARKHTSGNSTRSLAIMLARRLRAPACYTLDLEMIKALEQLQVEIEKTLASVSHVK